MIILDTHIWVWWSGEDTHLADKDFDVIDSKRADGIGISAISCWEIAQLCAKNRLALSKPALQWIELSLAMPNVILLPLSPKIAVDSCNLPGDFHKDPADRIIVATARMYDCELITYDSKILEYGHVKLLP